MKGSKSINLDDKTKGNLEDMINNADNVVKLDDLDDVLPEDKKPKFPFKKKTIKESDEELTSLSNYYDTLKAERERPIRPIKPIGTIDNPVVFMRNKCMPMCNELKNDCAKHIILDIYCKVLPLDKDFIHGHRGQMCSDIDNMLANKGMSATQYLKSCFESTNAPLLEFINRSINNIGNAFLEAEVEKAKEAVAKGAQIPDPVKPEVDEKEINNQLIDITGDPDSGVKGDLEYSNFIDKLKQKTINKIVSDVTKIINDKKEEKEITFDPKPLNDTQSLNDQNLANESTTSIGLNYINKRLIKESIEIDETIYDTMMGLAIRESTLNIIDECFRQPNSDIRGFNTKIRLGKGNVITEAAVSTISNSSSSSDNTSKPTIKEVNGKKYDVSNFSEIGSDGVNRPLRDADAKRVLGPQEYENYKKTKGNQ